MATAKKMTITNFRVTNAAGKKIPADPVGTDVAFACFGCGRPVLLSTFLSHHGQDESNIKSCRTTICDAKYFMKVQEENATVIIHCVDSDVEHGEETAEFEESDADEQKELKRAIRAYRKQTVVLGKLYDHMLNFLCAIVPEKPSKEMKQTDPKQYKKEKSIRRRAQAELGELLCKAKKFEAEDEQFRKREHNIRAQCYAHVENQRLAKYFPQLHDPDGRREFFEHILQSGKMFGFSDEEISETYDHRIMRLLFYAWKGKPNDNDKLN